MVQDEQHQEREDAVDSIEHVLVPGPLLLNGIQQLSADPSLLLDIKKILESTILQLVRLPLEVDLDISRHVFTGISDLLGVLQLLSLSEDLVIDSIRFQVRHFLVTS